MAQVGFTETLAKEGAKHNILANVIAPVAASRLTATVLPPEALAQIQPEWIVPLVADLVHSSNTTENGSVFEVGGGYVAKLRWERSNGLLLKPDQTYTPSSILKRWAQVNDFSKPEHPSGASNMLTKLDDALKIKNNEQGPEIRFDDKVVLITGGSAE